MSTNLSASDSFGSWGSGSSGGGFGSSGFGYGGSSGYGSSGGGFGSSGGGSSGGGGLFGGRTPVRNLLGRIGNGLHNVVHHGSSGGSSGGSVGSSSGYSWGSSGGGSSGGSSGGSTGYYSGYSASNGGYASSFAATGTPYYSSNGYGSTGNVISAPVTQGYYDSGLYSPSTSPAYQPYGSPIYNAEPSYSVPQSYGYPEVSPTPTPTPSTGSETPTPANQDPAAKKETNLKIRVPENAQIFVNNRPTKSTGNERSFVARRLTPGKEYQFQVKAVIDRDGKTEERTEIVSVRGGDSKLVTINFDQPESLWTSVEIKLPENAKLNLAGHESKRTGSIRTFSTDQLKSGESWEGYKVVATIERDGKTITQEKIIDVSAGKSHQVEFNFDDVRVASK